jgi:hypothetical protein
VRGVGARGVCGMCSLCVLLHIVLNRHRMTRVLLHIPLQPVLTGTLLLRGAEQAGQRSQALFPLSTSPQCGMAARQLRGAH